MFSPNSCVQFKQNLWESKPHPVYIRVAFAQVLLAFRFFNDFLTKMGVFFNFFQHRAKGPRPGQVGAPVWWEWVDEGGAISFPAGAGRT